MIHVVKKLFDIRSPHILVAMISKKFLCAFDGSKKSFSFSARPNIVEKRVVKNVDQILIQKTMNHTIAHRSDLNMSSFPVCHHKRPVSAVMIILVF